MDKIRWGIIGPGSIAHNFADALKQSYSGELISIASRTPSKLEEFGNKYQIKKEFIFKDYDALLENENIDAVYIATPHVFHADLSIRAAGKGKHILCEKPGAVNFAEASRVIEKIKEGDIVGVEPLLRCGICSFCVSGDYHVCGERGLVGENEDGGMSDLANVPANTVFTAPSGVDPELGALAEPLACSVHGYHKVGLRGHETVFIVGAGTIGLTAILAARANGSRVIVLARHPHQQEAARRLGADEVIGEDE